MNSTSRHSRALPGRLAALLRSGIVSMYIGVAGAVLGSSVAHAGEDPAVLVDAMSMALKTLNYDGRFVHIQGGNVTSMHILHSSDARGELERMMSLDGEAREVIRNHSLVTCIWPNSQSVVVSKSKPRDLLPDVSSSLAENERYTFLLGEPDRVAGIDTHVVDVQPKDKFRYGYRFWIDRNNFMLLRSMLLDGPDNAIEQVMFVEISYPDKIDPLRFNLNVSEDHISWLEPKNALAQSPALLNASKDGSSAGYGSSSSNSGKSAAQKVDRVGFNQLPHGYAEISETYRPMPINEGPISHVMVSDGMASVSVYVEYVVVAEQVDSSTGLSTMGAMNAYGMSLDTAFVTVVGEVPASTVKAIAEAVVLKTLIAAVRHTATVLDDCVVEAGESAQVLVELDTPAACARCAKGQGCGALFAGPGSTLKLHCVTDRSLCRGQQVSVATGDPGAGWLWIVLLAYGLPTLGLLVGAVLLPLLWTTPQESSGLQGIVVILTLVGLAGGVLAWHCLAPLADRYLSRGPCALSARIVSGKHTTA